MNIALDVGSHEFRSLRIDGGRLVARCCRSAYVVLDDSESTREILKQVGISWAVCDGQLIVYGDAAERVSQLFRIPCLELLPGGMLPADNPPVRQMVATLVESLVGRADENGAMCALTLPVTTNSGGDWKNQQREFISRLLKLQGYVPLELSSPQALVLAELGEQTFTGIGLVFGAGSSQAGLIHRGNVLAQCDVPYAGNWIDLRLARAQQVHFWDVRGNKYLDVNTTNAWKHVFNGSLRAPVSSRDQQLADLHRGMVEFLLREAAMKFGPEIKRFGIVESLPVVISGGTARIPGFADLVRDVLPTVSLPVRIGDVQLSAENDYTVARGGLIRVELETGEEAAMNSAA